MSKTSEKPQLSREAIVEKTREHARMNGLEQYEELLVRGALLANDRPEDANLTEHERKTIDEEITHPYRLS